MNFDETDAAIKKLGTFALLSSKEIGEEQLLPLYYTLQQIEQVFDINKNYADMLPIRVQSEEAFAGHMLICFIATAIVQRHIFKVQVLRSICAEHLIYS